MINRCRNRYKNRGKVFQRAQGKFDRIRIKKKPLHWDQ